MSAYPFLDADKHECGIAKLFPYLANCIYFLGAGLWGIENPSLVAKAAIGKTPGRGQEMSMMISVVAFLFRHMNAYIHDYPIRARLCFGLI